MERLLQWVLLKDGTLPAHPDHESDAEALDPIEEEEGEEQLSVPSVGSDNVAPNSLRELVEPLGPWLDFTDRTNFN